jgi:hypothetical protein
VELNSKLSWNAKERDLSTFHDLRPVVYKAETMLAERALLRQVGPQLEVVHRFRKGPCGCQNGEEVFAVFLLSRGDRILIRLPLALRLIFDYLARHRRVPQSATEIASGMRATAFYRDHGANSGVPSRRKISRTAVKEYVKRIRVALADALDAARLPLNANTVLESVATPGNEVLYALRATVAWLHEGTQAAETEMTHSRTGRATSHLSVHHSTPRDGGRPQLKTSDLARLDVSARRDQLSLDSMR